MEAARDELQKLARDNELLEDDLNQKSQILQEERKNKHKLEQIIGDCSGSLKQALTVSYHSSFGVFLGVKNSFLFLFVLFHFILQHRTIKYLAERLPLSFIPD